MNCIAAVNARWRVMDFSVMVASITGGVARVGAAELELTQKNRTRNCTMFHVVWYCQWRFFLFSCLIFVLLIFFSDICFSVGAFRVLHVSAKYYFLIVSPARIHDP